MLQPRWIILPAAASSVVCLTDAICVLRDILNGAMSRGNTRARGVCWVLGFKLRLSIKSENLWHRCIIERKLDRSLQKLKPLPGRCSWGSVVVWLPVYPRSKRLRHLKLARRQDRTLWPKKSTDNQDPARTVPLLSLSQKKFLLSDWASPALL